MTTCYLIVGPESAGNRVLAACLIAGGAQGDTTARTAAPGSSELPEGEDRAVVIRSFPHGGEWPDMDLLLFRLMRCYDLVTVLVTVRHPVALWRSQVARGHVGTTAEAHDHSRHAWVRIFAALGRAWGRDGLEWLVVPYESLADGAEALLGQLGLVADLSLVEVEGRAVPLENRNPKHFRTVMEAT